MKFKIFALALAATTPLLAGKMTLTGKCSKGHAPQYLRIAVDVKSQCYGSDTEVLQATNGAANRIKQIMKSHMSNSADSRDELNAVPGRTTMETVTVYDHETRKNRIVCEDGWSASNTLVLKISSMNEWSSLQKKITAVARENRRRDSRGQASTRITIHSPVPALFPETVKSLKEKAEAQALAKASAQFNRIAMNCGFFQPTIVSVDKGHGSASPYFSAKRASANDSASADFTPEYGKIYVHSSWNVTFEFVDSGSGCAVE